MRQTTQNSIEWGSKHIQCNPNGHLIYGTTLLFPNTNDKHSLEMDIGCVYIRQSLLNLASLMYLSVEKGGLISIIDAEKGGSNPWSLPINFKCSLPPPLKEETRSKDCFQALIPRSVRRYG